MKIIFGIKIPNLLIDNLNKKTFNLFKIFKLENFSLFGIIYVETDEKVYEIDDSKIKEMNDFSENYIKNENNTQYFVKDIEQMLQTWSDYLQNIVKNIDNYSENELKEKYEQLDMPENLEFNWYILND